jgi:hypothetical protein
VQREVAIKHEGNNDFRDTKVYHVVVMFLTLANN